MLAETEPVSETGIDHALAQRVVDHWKKVIPATDLRSEPFGHFCVENVFPDDVYQSILDLKLGSEHLKAINLKTWSRSDGTSTRDWLYLADEAYDALDPERRVFWATLSHALCSDVFRRLIYDKLKADIALRLAIDEDQVADAPTYVGAWLVRDTDGYRIKPHPDGHPRVVTIMFYLPEDDSRTDLGTSVYEEGSRFERLTGKRFKEVYRFPFKRNSMAVFAVNDLPGKRSLHGRELVETSGERNSILVSFENDPIAIKGTDKVLRHPHKDLS